MDPLLELKRKREDDFEQCIICQDIKHEKLLTASKQGLTTLKESASLRHKLRDSKNRVIIDRIMALQEEASFMWHKSCYSSFTSKSKISRLEKSSSPNNSSAACSSVNQDQGRNLRSSTPPINWDLCMFCQKTGHTKLSSVTTFKMSKQILDASKYDHMLSVQLSGIHDLIASEGKYHCTCYKAWWEKLPNCW